MYNEYDLMFLNEAYYGKTNGMLEIEKKVGEIRKKYFSSQTKVNTSPEIRELEKLLCDEFGFEDCQFYIDMSALHNAYTIPVSVADIGHKRDKLVTSSADGLKYKKEAKAYIFISVTRGLFFSYAYTDGEITALIMHEVGHNFQSVISNPVCRTVRTVNNVLRWVMIPFLCVATGPLRDKFMHLIKEVRNNASWAVEGFNALQVIVMTVAGIWITFGRIFTNIMSMLNPLGSLAKMPIKMLLSLKSQSNFFLPLSYRDESVADNFSTAYGYGPELSTALNKMKQNSGGMIADQMFRDSLFGAYFDLVSLPDKVITNIFDPHPNTIARMKEQYEMLEKELLNSSLKPSMKAQIKKDMKDIEKTMEAFTEFEDGGYFFSNLLDKFLLKFVKGDIRSMLSKGTEEELDKIDKMYRDE